MIKTILAAVLVLGLIASAGRNHGGVGAAWGDRVL
jgi:hypothetical protein